MRCLPLVLFLVWLLGLTTVSFGQTVTGRFSPTSGKVIVFAGGGNEAVGGTQKYRDGYVDNINIPGGVSHTIRFAADPNTNSLTGLTDSVDWGAGPMHLKAFLDSPILDRCAIHLSVAILGSDLPKIASGKQDWLINELTDFVASHSDHPFFLEIGPEFDNPENKYAPEQFRAAFRRIADAHRNRQLANVAFVLGSSNAPRVGDFERYDPGKDYVDWVAYSWYELGDGQAALDFAAKIGRPVFISRATPRGRNFGEDDSEEVWANWFVPFFKHLEVNEKYIRGVSYTNVDFEAHELSKGWGNTRIDASRKILQNWRDQMNQPKFLNSVDKPFELIQFPSPFVPVKKVAPSDRPRYKDAEFTIDQRLSDLMSRMTIEEKCAQLSGWRGSNEQRLRNQQGIYTSEFYKKIAPHGIGAIAPLFLSTEEDFRQYYAIQSYFVEETRLGIPAMRYSNASHGLVRMEATSFPSPISLSATWNPQLVQRVYQHVAKEAVSRGIHFLVTADINPINDLRSGHSDNSFGQNPFLAGRFGESVVQGFQAGGQRKVAVGVTFTGEDFLPLQHVVRVTDPTAIIQGLKANDQFLKTMPFEGIVATTNRVEDKKIAFYLDESYSPLKSVEAGQLSIESIDSAVRQVLKLKFELGLFENPLLDIEVAEKLYTDKEADQLALEAASQSIVLLKNDGLLPLDKSTIKTVALIGPNADVCRLGTHSGTPKKTWSLLDGVKQYLGDAVTVNHAKGCLISINDTNDSYQNWKYVNTVNLASIEQNMPLIEKAVSVAHESDVVILSLGEAEFLARGFEQGLRPDNYTPLELTDAQKRLASSVLQTGKPVILYLSHSRPIYLGDIGEKCQAILTGHYNGQRTGSAAAEVVFGVRNPSAKLTVGWPSSSTVNEKEMAYPFGHGLSYTEFEYSEPSMATDSLGPGESVEFSVEVSNVGDREGVEIVQLYANQAEVKPQLLGFRRLKLAPGATQTAAFNIQDAEFFDQNQTPLNGSYSIQVGPNSQDLSEPKILAVEVVAGLAKRPVDKEEASDGGGLGDLGFLATSPPKVLPMPQAVEDAAASSKQNGKPNILFLAVDDMRPELGLNGVRFKTPNIDQLARTGISFEKAYCQRSSGDASRLSVMTSLYPSLLQEKDQKIDGWRKRLEGVVTLNQYLRQHSYQTIGIGKVYPQTAGVDADLGNWNQWVNLYAPKYQAEENLAFSQTTPNPTEKGPVAESAQVDDDTYIDGKRAKQAAAMLEELAKSSVDEQPFFLAVGFSRPQMPYNVPNRYWDAYERSEFQMPINRNVPLGYPPFITSSQAAGLLEYKEFNDRSPSGFSLELNQKLLHGYAASVSYVDACIGEIMDVLRTSDLADNTIVVLWGDNGVKLGDHSSWGGGSNFECDTRVPLIISDPRNTTNAGLSTDSAVELVDLYPTLCEMAGVKAPIHCQGKSFAGLIEDMGTRHRLDSLSSYPTESGGIGYSLRYQDYRYSKWFDEKGDQTHQVLINLELDPGEQTNVVDDSVYQELVRQLSIRLDRRIVASRSVPASYEGVIRSPEMQSASEYPPVELSFDISDQNRRQRIDGFGGSIAFLGTNADDKALEAAIFGLNLQYLRVRGEVPISGVLDHNRSLLSRALAINPKLKIMLSFWQPRTANHLDLGYWMDEREIDGVRRNVIKPERENEWAIEMVNRIQTYINWGINVTAVSVQNEPNQSIAGTQSCYWEPENLALFIEEKFNPKMNAAGLGAIKIVSPELSAIGDRGIEFDRYIPALTSPSADIASFHMNGGYRSGTKDYSLQPLINNVSTMVNLKRLHFPDKKVWMTETSGAHWLSAERHTYGWKPNLTEHEKAIKAARYMHTALDVGEVNAFFWWGLVYSLPAAGDKQETTYQHRDEGLILVDGEDENGIQTMIEKTKKFYTFRQFSAFVKPGYQRINVNSPEHLPVSLYLSQNERVAVAIAINDSASPKALVVKSPAGMKLLGSFQTDKTRDCSPITPQSKLPPQSVRTLIFAKENN